MKKYFKHSLFLILCNLVSLSHFADGEITDSHFVAIDGANTGDCSADHHPCSSIKYAINQAAKSSHVLIASGTYRLEAEDVVHFLGDKVPLVPGYSRADDYKTQSIENNPVTLVGIPFEFREQLAAKGFRIVADTKPVSSYRASQIDQFTQKYQRVSKQQKTFTACTNGLAGDFPCENVDLMSQLPLPSFSNFPTSGSDIWGHVNLNDNREYALIGLNNGTSIVDVSDPEFPVEVGTITGANSTWRDIKVFQRLNGTSYEAFAYVTTEANDGLQIIDLNDLPNSVSLANTDYTFQSAHNIYISNIDYSTNTALPGLTPYIYIAGSNQNSGAFMILDLVDPVNPALVTSPPIGTGYVHDATSLSITDSRSNQCLNGHNPCEVLIDFNEATVDIWDMTDKANPFKISATPYANSGYTHSGWYSKDKNFIFIQDELDERNLGLNTTLRVLDISSLTSPTLAGSYTGTTQAIDHNGFTLGDKYFMSNYRRGLTILDVTDPVSPLEIAYFDTFPAPADNSANFDGAWGAYPYLPSGNILISDINNGLLVLKDNSTLGVAVSEPPPPPTSTPAPIAPVATNTGGGGGSVGYLFLLFSLTRLATSLLKSN